MNIGAILLSFAIMLSGCFGSNTEDNVTGQDISDREVILFEHKSIRK